MPHHKINSIEDIKKLIGIYEDGAIFEVLETGEELTLDDLHSAFLIGSGEAVGNMEGLKEGCNITIQHI